MSEKYEFTLDRVIIHPDRALARIKKLEAALSTYAEPVVESEPSIYGSDMPMVKVRKEWFDEDNTMVGRAKSPAPAVAVKALDADDVINDLAALPCETHGVEDLEVGCCRTCRARSIRSALSAQVQDVAGWREISTAPKDGTPILGGHSEAVLTVWWESDGSKNSSGEPGWIDGSFTRYEENYTYPVTHWMPLPAAPAAKQGEAV